MIGPSYSLRYVHHPRMMNYGGRKLNGYQMCSIAYNVLAIVQSRWGLGLPKNLRPMANGHNLKVLSFAGRPFYMMGVAGFKVALCLAYLRIVPPGTNAYKPIIWMVLVSCVIAHVARTLVFLLKCKLVCSSH